MKKIFVGLFFTLSSSLFTYCKAQYTILHSFNDTLGKLPFGSLTLSGNVLYGMAFYGGVKNDGCIFSIDTDGSNYEVLLNFDSINGKNPSGSLTISGNVLYGMTGGGGANDSGCIFSINTDGSGYKDLLDFTYSKGVFPFGSLTLSGGVLYGMTQKGGGVSNWGCIFSINTDGSGYKNLLNFGNTNGGPSGDLTLSGNILYGMATGGTFGSSNIFSINTNGTGYRELLTFNDVDGYFPQGSLTLSGNVLYGMTSGGGAIDNDGCVFSIHTDGSDDTVLLNFDTANGMVPWGTPTLSGNTLYGMTVFGGANDSGCIFSVNTNGTGYIDLFNFNGINGAEPFGNLLLSGNVLYGMAASGGTNDDGVIFGFKDTNGGLGVNELRTNNEAVRVYPNPTNGNFNLSLSKINESCNVEIYNVLGEKVYSEALLQSQSNINLTGQPNGVYLYRVINQSGELVGEGKIAIER